MLKWADEFLHYFDHLFEYYHLSRPLYPHQHQNSLSITNPITSIFSQFQQSPDTFITNHDDNLLSNLEREKEKERGMNKKEIISKRQSVKHKKILKKRLKSIKIKQANFDIQFPLLQESKHKVFQIQQGLIVDKSQQEVKRQLKAQDQVIQSPKFISCQQIIPIEVLEQVVEEVELKQIIIYERQYEYLSSIITQMISGNECKIRAKNSAQILIPWIMICGDRECGKKHLIEQVVDKVVGSYNKESNKIIIVDKRYMNQMKIRHLEQLGQNDQDVHNNKSQQKCYYQYDQQQYQCNKITIIIIQCIIVSGLLSDRGYQIIRQYAQRTIKRRINSRRQQTSINTINVLTLPLVIHSLTYRQLQNLQKNNKEDNQILISSDQLLPIVVQLTSLGNKNNDAILKESEKTKQANTLTQLLCNKKQIEQRRRQGYALFHSHHLIPTSQPQLISKLHQIFSLTLINIQIHLCKQFQSNYNKGIKANLQLQKQINPITVNCNQSVRKFTIKIFVNKYQFSNKLSIHPILGLKYLQNYLKTHFQRKLYQILQVNKKENNQQCTRLGSEPMAQTDHKSIPLKQFHTFTLSSTLISNFFTQILPSSQSSSLIQQINLTQLILGLQFLLISFYLYLTHQLYFNSLYINALKLYPFFLMVTKSINLKQYPENMYWEFLQKLSQKRFIEFVKDRKKCRKLNQNLKDSINKNHCKRSYLSKERCFKRKTQKIIPIRDYKNQNFVLLIGLDKIKDQLSELEIYQKFLTND